MGSLYSYRDAGLKDPFRLSALVAPERVHTHITRTRSFPLEAGGGRDPEAKSAKKSPWL